MENQDSSLGDAATDAARARQFAYVVVLLQEAKVDTTKILPGEVIFALASPYERRGYTSADIDNWMKACDSASDPVSCFRGYARAAMVPKPGMGLPLLAIGAASFFAAFLVSKSRK